MQYGRLGLFGLLIILIGGSQNATGASLPEELVTLDTRPGIEQPFGLMVPKKAKVAVLLFAGGNGKLKIKKIGDRAIKIRSKSSNFVVRTRHDYAEAGMAVATIDVPSDGTEGLNMAFRMGEEHATDIKQVVSYLKQRLGLPVWLIGTSRGSVSVTNGAVALGDDIDGLVLTSSITRSKPSWSVYDAHPRAILNMGMDQITVPTFVMAHMDDGCEQTPAADVPDIVAALQNSRSVQSMIMKGGKTPKDKPCKALSKHGFYGIEDEALKNIINFINANTR